MHVTCRSAANLSMGFKVPNQTSACGLIVNLVRINVLFWGSLKVLRALATWWY